MQMQIQALLVVEEGKVPRESNTRFNIKVAKPSVFNKEVEKVEGFIVACKLYLRMKIRGETIEKQIQWILSYIQGELANVQKKNILEDLELEKVEFKSVGEFLLELKKEFSGEDGELVKVAELRKIEQRGGTIEEFI